MNRSYIKTFGKISYVELVKLPFQVRHHKGIRESCI